MPTAIDLLHIHIDEDMPIDTNRALFAQVSAHLDDLQATMNALEADSRAYELAIKEVAWDADIEAAAAGYALQQARQWARQAKLAAVHERRLKADAIRGQLANQHGRALARAREAERRQQLLAEQAELREAERIHHEQQAEARQEQQAEREAQAQAVRAKQAKERGAVDQFKDLLGLTPK